MWTALAVTCVTSSMFLTALAPNLLVVEIIRKTAKIDISWTDWFLAAAPFGFVMLLLLPLLVYWIYPPEIKEGDEVPKWAANELAAQQKAPIPGEQAQQASQKAAGDLYGGRFRQAKTTAEKTALATEMIDAALKVKDGSADQYVLLKIARDMAAGAGDAPTALRTVEKTVERFDVPGAKLTAETVGGCTQGHHLQPTEGGNRGSVKCGRRRGRRGRV